MKRQLLPYCQWQPLITPEEVFSDYIHLGDVKAVGDNLYWLEGRPAENGRVVLVQRDSWGNINDVTPAEYYIRSRVHEYGGSAWAIRGELVVFVNFKDQRIYKQIIGRDPVSVTPEHTEGEYFHKYGGLEISTDNNWLVFVWEKEHADPGKTVNVLGCIDLTADGIVEPVELRAGRDFYSRPSLSPAADKIAWTSWDFPYMPWDSTELTIADFNNGRIVESSIKQITGGYPEAVLSHQFDTKGDLYFVMDRAGCDENDAGNWANIYRYHNDKIEVITAMQAEFGFPQWGLGTSQLATGNKDKLLAAYFKQGKNKLLTIDTVSNDINEIPADLNAFGSLSFVDEQQLALIGSRPDISPAVFILDLTNAKYREIIASTSSKMHSDDISLAEHISFPTSDGETSYGYLYLPGNTCYLAPEKEKPPLIVMAHGGPTARTSASSLSLSKQFWTTQGYAILDVDYRGSNGYGRSYRDALLGKWGISDAQDIANGVRYLIKKGIVHPGRIAITGGSAGGYAVQRALTEFPELFQAGASYYGIGNLETLARLTHKFESRYLDQLIGRPYVEGDFEYKERSPISHLDQLQAPLILFQGADDKIVPPETSREMKRILDEKGLRCEYVEYEGEAHGFRSKANNIDALNREAAFYREVFLQDE